MKSSHILGINARNHLYLSRYNHKRGKRIADSKLLTKKFLVHHKLPHPRLIASFSKPAEIQSFDWSSLKEDFVVKPAAAYAGEGIILVRRRLSGSEKFQLMDQSKTTLADIKLHILDILEGRFDKYDLPGVALIEERIRKHPCFRLRAYQGTPDVRILVFNHVPIVAMLRLPTKESRGRANRSQGAICVGIDLAAGMTTQAIQWDKPIVQVPGYPKLKFNGLQIPWWDRMMELSVEVQEHMALGYMAVDFLIDPEKGPVIVELTARPGLSIQLANGVGLRRRLERIEGLEVEHGRGVEMAKALFAERFSDKIVAEKGVKIVSVFESVKLKDGKGKKKKIAAKLDTGAYRSSIDRSLAEELGLLTSRSILYHDNYWSSLGQEKRPIIPVAFWLSGRKVETTANVANRSKLVEKLLIGRRDLSTFMIRPAEE